MNPTGYFRRRLCLPAWGAALLAAGCATQGVALQEYDSLLLPPKASSPYEPLRYGDSSLRFPWFYRQWEGTGVDWLLVNLFGIEPSPHRVRRPLVYARERLQVMGRAARPRDVQEAAFRLILAALQDPWRLNRITALQSLEQLVLRIGPGPAPPPSASREPPKPPLLDRAFRARVDRERRRGRWDSLRAAARKTFLAALSDPVQAVRVEALQKTYEIWGIEGLRTAVLVHQKWGPQGWSPAVIRKAAYLCQGALPEDARDRNGGPSLLDVLHQWIRKLPSEELVMDCQKAEAAILGTPPRYGPSFLQEGEEKKPSSGQGRAAPGGGKGGR